jgi:hypothetical protein
MLTQRIIDFYFKGNAKEREAGFMDHAITQDEVVIKTENCNGDCSACSMSVKN